MKIELKHLAPYLPYKLMLYKEGFPHTELNGLDTHNDYSYWKPILRPMSDLKKEIPNKGEKITPIYWLEEQYFSLDLHEQAKELIKDPRWVNQSDYMLICHLIEWHFDVFGLIEKGLAIDINTLENGN